MKKTLLTVFGLALTCSVSFAQSSDRKFAVGVNGGLTDYHGEANQQWFNISDFRGQVGLTGMYYINSWLNTGIDASYGKYGHHVPNSGGVKANLFQANAQLRLKINNGKWLKEDARIQPYLFVGTGLANFAIDGDKNLIAPGTDWTGNGGVGFNIMATEWLGFNYNLNYAMTNKDRRDGQTGLENDQFMIHSVGVLFHLGKKADADGDGVSDKKDKCPSTPANVKVDAYGCPVDSDNDGVADYLDACPTVAGTIDTEGCPDSDNDGIIDSEDTCPMIAGVASANGCPDADGDGIQDAKDNCPKVAGLATLNGCPDTDGDGITDAEDTCPNVKGSVEMNGCPDSDNDGIADNVDKCPTVAGVTYNEGCP